MATRADVARIAGSKRARTAGVVAGGRRAINRRDLTDLVQLFLDPPAPPPRRRATEDDAMGLPPFGRAVALLANAAASTEWYARRRRDPIGLDGLQELLPDQPNILTDPDPMTTPWHYRWGAIEDGILYGNHFALYGDLDWRTLRPGWLVPIPADEVWVMTDPAQPWWHQWVIGGVTFDVDELFHVPFGARSGQLLGRGVLNQYGWWLAGANDAEDYSRDTFAAGALPPAVITSKQVQNQKDADDLKRKWRELTSTREPVVLPDGTELKPIVGNAEQQQLVQARTWNAQQVANAVGVPGWKLGLAGPSMTYQNVQDADVDWVRDGVDRWARPLTAMITKWLLPHGTEATWDYAGRMRADQRTTKDVLTAYTNAGIFTVDEARASLGRGPLVPTPAAEPPADEPDGGDETDPQPTEDVDGSAPAGLPNPTSGGTGA